MISNEKNGNFTTISPDHAGSIQSPFNSRPLCDLISPIGLVPGLQMA